VRQALYQQILLLAFAAYFLFLLVEIVRFILQCRLLVLFLGVYVFRGALQILYILGNHDLLLLGSVWRLAEAYFGLQIGRRGRDPQVFVAEIVDGREQLELSVSLFVF